MNKQRFSVVYEKFTSKDIIPKGIMDNKKNNHMCRIEEVCDVLNEQQATIEQLRTQLLICQQSKNDNGGFQVWEVPPIPKGKRISFTTNNDGGDGV